MTNTARHISVLRYHVTHHAYTIAHVTCHMINTLRATLIYFTGYINMDILTPGQRKPHPFWTLTLTFLVISSPGCHLQLV